MEAAVYTVGTLDPLHFPHVVNWAVIFNGKFNEG